MELLGKSTANNFLFGGCCLEGKIELPELQELPVPLNTLLTDQTHEVVSFRRDIRRYNSTLAFTSLQATFDRRVLDGCGPYALNLQGALYHSHYPFLARHDNPQDAIYAQLYIYDAQVAYQTRMNRNEQALHGPTLHALQDMMEAHNPYVTQYKNTIQCIRESGHNDRIRIFLSYDQTTDCYTHNLPTGDEIAALIPDGALLTQP